MARPVWSGTISFGLVAIPVKLFHAVRRQSVSFNQLDERNMARIRYRKVNAETGEEVGDDHIVKGYEISKGRYVVVDPDELEPFMPVATKSIDLEEFVDLADIDPVYFDTAYHLAPDGPPKPYVLLARAMEASGKVAIGRFVMRNKQYTAAIRAEDGRLVMSTLAYADEVLDPADIDELQGLDAVEVNDKEVAMAGVARRVAHGRLRAREVPRRVPRGSHGAHPDEGRRRGVRDAGSCRREAQGRRHHGCARGQRRCGEGGPYAASGQEALEGDEEVGLNAASARIPAMAAPIDVDIGGRTVRLTNLDKVLYPSGFTKAEVVDYHARIAPWIIPHLAGRCITFRRYPDGTDQRRLLREALPDASARVGAGRARAR